jgi:hypothetical protein
MKQHPQARMDAAFDRYLAMSDALQDDVEAILTADDGSQSHRRNLIRAASALVEGYGSCFREICAIGLETGPGNLNSREVRALEDERSLGSADRTKLTLRAAYKMLQLPRPPKFGDPGWPKAKKLLKKRDALMHPKTVQDLSVPDEEWDEINEGVRWLFAQLFGLVKQLAEKHGT